MSSASCLLFPFPPSLPTTFSPLSHFPLLPNHLLYYILASLPSPSPLEQWQKLHWKAYYRELDTSCRRKSACRRELVMSALERLCLTEADG